MWPFKTTPKTFGEQVTQAVISALRKHGVSAPEPILQAIVGGILSPEVTLFDAASICAAVLGGKLVLWPGSTTAPEMKEIFDEKWRFFLVDSK